MEPLSTWLALRLAVCVSSVSSHCLAFSLALSRRQERKAKNDEIRRKYGDYIKHTAVCGGGRGHCIHSPVAIVQDL